NASAAAGSPSNIKFIWNGNDTNFLVSSSILRFQNLITGTDIGNNILKVTFVNQTLATRENSTVISSSVYDASANIPSATLYLFAPSCCSSAAGETFLTWLSPDNGNTWEEVTQAVEHTFINPGTNLKWRIDFNTTEPDNFNSTIVLTQINISIPSGSPENITIDFGADGTTDFTFPGQLNSTNLQTQVNLSFVNISSSFISDNLLEKTSSRNYEHTYKIPLNISSQTIGTITMEAINLTYSPNPVVLNISNLSQIFGNSINFTTFRIPMAASNLSTEFYSLVTLDDLKYDYAGGNFSINLTAYHITNHSINITREIFFYYSRWGFSFVPKFVNFLEFIPQTPSEQNVTPFGQSSWPNSKQILNITNLGYGGRDSHLSVYLNETLSCVNLTMSTTENKTGGSIINASWLNLSLNTSYLEATNIYMWADYSCSFNNFTLFQPFIFFRQCAEGINFCSEDIT
ncbi:hypothetical protein LCGC14_1486340, partial [marine sediment metagenome]